MASKKPEKPVTTLLAILELRKDLAGFKAEVAGVRQGLDDLTSYVKESEIRLGTEIVAMGGTLREIRDLLRAASEDQKRWNDHEQRLVALERKAG